MRASRLLSCDASVFHELQLIDERLWKDKLEPFHSIFLSPTHFPSSMHCNFGARFWHRGDATNVLSDMKLVVFFYSEFAKACICLRVWGSFCWQWEKLKVATVSTVYVDVSMQGVKAYCTVVRGRAACKLKEAFIGDSLNIQDIFFLTQNNWTFQAKWFRNLLEKTTVRFKVIKI